MKEAVLCAGHGGIGLAASREASLVAASQSAEVRSRLRMTRQLVAPSGILTPRAMLRAAVLAKSAALADRILADAIDPENGVAGANLALRTLDAVDPLVEVSEVTTTSQLLAKVSRGEDPTWTELRAVFGQQDPPSIGASPPEADAVEA